MRFRVQSGIQHQRIDVRIHAIQKIIADPGLLTFVEPETVQQVRFCRSRNANLHHGFPASSRIRDLASFQGETGSSPLSSLAIRSDNTV